MLGLGVSLVFGFYHLILSNRSGGYYSPLVLNEQAPSFTTDEANAYAPQVKEMLEGNFWSSDFFIYEYKNYPSPFVISFLPTMFMAGLAKLAGGIDKGFILADFSWPVLSWLVLSYFIYKLTKKAYLAPVGSLLVINLGHYLSYFPFLPSVLKKMVDAWSIGAYSHFIRSFHPQISFLMIMIFCLFLYQIQTDQSKKYQPWWLGLSIGALFYTYIYYWTFAVAWILVLIVINYLYKNKLVVNKLLIGLFVGLAMAIPLLNQIWQFQKLAISQSFNQSFEHLPSVSLKAIAILMIMMIVSRLFIKNVKERVFWWTLFLSVIGLFMAIHLFNLKVDDPIGHWMNRVGYPFSLILILIMLIRRVRKKELILSLGLGLSLLLYQTRVHWRYFENKVSIFQLESERVEVFNWLNHNTAKESVVLTTSLIDNTYLPIYTHNNVFIPFSILSLTPTDEAEERFLLTYKAMKISEIRIRQMFNLTKDNQQLRLKKRFNFDDCGGHYLYYRQFVESDFYNCSVPREYLNQLLVQYQEIDGDLEAFRNKYRMDYWLWGPNEKQWASVNLDELGWQVVWQNQDYKVIKLF